MMRVILLVIIALAAGVVSLHRLRSEKIINSSKRRSLVARHDPKTVTPKVVVTHLTESQRNEIMWVMESRKYKAYLDLIDEGYSTDMVVTICRDPIDKLVEWAKALKVRYLYFYSKCRIPKPNLLTLVKIRWHNLRNVGREGHSWLHHILRTDIDHGDFNIFLQGKVESNLEAIVTARLAMSQLPHYPPYDFVDFTQLRGGKKNSHYINQHIYRVGGNGKDLGICAFHERFKSDPNEKCEDVRVSWRGEFIVTGDLLRQANRTKLENLKAELSLQNGPREGFYLERIWPSVLGATALPYVNLRWGTDLSSDKEFKTKYPLLEPVFRWEW
jgi:hypothetical protein